MRTKDGWAYDPAISYWDSDRHMTCLVRHWCRSLQGACQQPMGLRAPGLWCEARDAARLGHRVTGRFELTSHLVNGFPAWKRAGMGAAMWLYSSNRGGLEVGGDGSVRPMVCGRPHGGGALQVQMLPLSFRVL